MTNPPEPPALLATFDAHDATQALNWIAVTLHTIRGALDQPATEAASAWLHEGRDACRLTLQRGDPYLVTITHATTRITWTIHPVLYLPQATHRTTSITKCRTSPNPDTQR
ncbi:hypothetical protein [Streptomyces sp. CAU 1734]|uniref:hypothetical protein n=1 Tax=Streptomyces sp. CAU 1734 TaxID=3140360 RepID=UPI00325FE167